MQMVMVVLDNPAHLGAVLDAWQVAGIRGATVLESVGMHRVRRQPALHARYAFGAARNRPRITMEHYTLLTIVPDEATARICLSAVEAVVGDLDQPDNGVFAAWELSAVKGILAEPPGTTDEVAP